MTMAMWMAWKAMSNWTICTPMICTTEAGHERLDHFGLLMLLMLTGMPISISWA